MTKQQELELIQELACEGSYFHEAFSETDINCMKNNIANDFPLLLQTSLEHYATIGRHFVESRQEDRTKKITASLTAYGIDSERKIIVNLYHGEAKLVVCVTPNKERTSYDAIVVSHSHYIEFLSDFVDDYIFLLKSLGRASFINMIWDNWLKISDGETVAREY
jgi:mitochondrial fission protein ELM1